MSDIDSTAYYSLVHRKDSAGDFYFLRKSPVDVMYYLPRFVAEERKVQDALSWEHENLRLKLADVSRQFYIETATWGLAAWERVYDVKPPAGADYALRRALVKAKMLGIGVMTVEAIKHLVNPFLFQPDADIDELPLPGTFRVIIHSGTDHMGEIRWTLAEMAPAHLVYKFLFSIEDLADDESANLADALAGRILIGYEDDYPYDPRPPLHDGSFCHGGVVRHDGRFIRDGTVFRDGIVPGYTVRAGGAVRIDELAAALSFGFYDDVSRWSGDIFHNGAHRHDGRFFRNGVIRRDGGFTRDGTMKHDGIRRRVYVLPMDWLSRLYSRQHLSDSVPAAIDKAAAAEIAPCLSDMVPYGTNPMPRHDGTHIRAGVGKRDGNFARDGSFIRDGPILGVKVLRAGKSDFEHDHLTVGAFPSFDDFPGWDYVRKDGRETRSGAFVRGLNPAPRDFKHSVSISTCFEDAAKTKDSGGRLTVKLYARKNGSFLRDGSVRRGARVLSGALEDGSVVRLRKNGGFRHDGTITRGGNALPVISKGAIF